MLKSRLILIVLLVTTGVLAAGSAPASARAIDYGVAPQGDLGSRDFAKMRSGGVDVLRVFIVFPDIKPVPPVANYDFSGLDRLIGDAARHRIRALPFIVGAPSWVPHGSQDPPKAWSEFVASVVARYGNGGTFWSDHPDIPRKPVKAWQIWNEQNSRAFFFTKPSPRSYAKLLHAAADAIRSQDPKADVVLGGMAELAGSSKAKAGTKYLRALYRIHGVKRDFDAIAVHAYAKEASVAVDQVERFRREMLRAHDRGAGLWVTEIGWSSANGGSPLAVGRSGQASRLREAFGQLAREKGRLGLRGIVWYSWADSRQTICDWCAKSGLVSGGGHPKPAYRQYKRAAR
jgi:hypothetical protein